ncbi:MAG: hypothetical protein DSO07_11440 [Thermoproteota archaeon]|uniref:Uncharacterized protein n=1 Tax=Candidatus Methanodesulfokora washburnensis TaxID=2478471 RepID=A0A429GFP5_9CREN|nr:hypothetical protein [Candidatus Methanodesulfokores washburnensis]RSN72733.1 hypothetical protein D6D85_12610 [Candidatus Methanodesulfokores washburnensis]RZN63657.1 MAG: hypothetical protein EF810_00355 [Candidatus Methanodesulfokores washburnensis]TDA38544.1 MAG: hypothetical protein DSO07_11440 [Candidatus Korarchaeota archaeon]
MSAARKILLALVIVVILFLLLLIAGALTYKPAFEIKGIGIVDHDGYPCFKIPFKTSNYPVTFRLLTKDGELIDTYVADKPEEVVYLHLTPFKPFTNVIGPKSYVIKAFYGDKEVYSSSFDVKGAKADLKIKDVSFNTSIFSLDLRKLTLEVRNEGDVPLYLTLIPINIELYLDGLHEAFAPYPSSLAIEPGNTSSLSLEPVALAIDPNYLDKEHRVDVVIPNVTRTSYIIEPLKPELRIEKVGLSPFLDKWSLNNITLIISNRGKYPINIRWLKIYVNEELNALWTPSIEVIGPGEEKKVILSLAAITSRPFTLKVKLGATEVSYSG